MEQPGSQEEAQEQDVLEASQLPGSVGEAWCHQNAKRLSGIPSFLPHNPME